jgi:hypothetical protein
MSNMTSQLGRNVPHVVYDNDREDDDFHDGNMCDHRLDDPSLSLAAAISESHDDDDSDRSSDGASGNYDVPKEKPLAKQETRKVTLWKLTVLSVLLISAFFTAAATYIFIKNSENAQFEKIFESSASKVLEAVGKSLEKTLKSLDSFAVAIVSHAHNTNQTWPFVAVPDFAIRAAKMISLSNAVFISILPLVSNQTREEWERFAATHDQWLNESVHLQERYDLFHGPLMYALGHIDVIWGDFGDIDYSVE